VRCAARTDAGVKPACNEDAFAVLPEANLFVVADGMGGETHGATASDMAVRALVAHFCARPSDFLWPYRPDADPSEIDDRLACAIHASNRLVYVSTHLEPARPGMGTTIVAAVVADGHIHIGHVGDSRAYRLRWGQLTRLTCDHSLPDELIAAGVLTEAEGRRCPRSLTRAVGIAETVDVAVARSELLVGDRILLCTHGLSTMLADDAIRDALGARRELGAIASDLVGRANRAGGDDNITVLVVERFV
jgi:protein phosphatase